MLESKLERNFWRFWLGGLLILAVMIAMNPWFVSDASPWGIRDYQSASTAARVDAIQAAWQAKDVIRLAQLGIAIDLIYIAVYSLGGRTVARMLAGPVPRRAIIAGMALRELTDTGPITVPRNHMSAVVRSDMGQAILDALTGDAW